VALRRIIDNTESVFCLIPAGDAGNGYELSLPIVLNFGADNTNYKAEWFGLWLANA
jgi:hypothetical protein